MVKVSLALLWLALSAVLAIAEEASAPVTPAKQPPVAEGPKTICAAIEAAAAEHDLPVEFFTRLIWKESTFRPEAMSPKGAQGIAQFMPGTAALRQLSDPFDPKEAIPASARYLKDLAARFGNLGLAAAAYNAGERRVADWLAGDAGLPWETRDYVLAITGRPAEDWAMRDPNLIAGGAPTKKPEPAADCLEIAAVLAKPGAGSAVLADIPKAAWAPWGVQVAGNFSLNRAMASYATFQRRFARVVGSGPPMVVRTVNRSRGRAPMFQIRMPASSRDKANDLCRKLQSAGGACVVLKN